MYVHDACYIRVHVCTHDTCYMCTCYILVQVCMYISRDGWWGRGISKGARLVLKYSFKKKNSTEVN